MPIKSEYLSERSKYLLTEKKIDLITGFSSQETIYEPDINETV
jgi:hypothetical protein